MMKPFMCIKTQKECNEANCPIEYDDYICPARVRYLKPSYRKDSSDHKEATEIKKQ